MMAPTQLHLFVPIQPHSEPPRALPIAGARSARDDPTSSYLAADEFRKSGQLARHQQIVLDGVRRCPGGTGAEIATEIPDLSELQVLRRLSELVDGSLIRRGELRYCRVKGRRCISWWPTEAGAQL